MKTSPLKIGNLKISPPVVLAPMAGITNAPFRRLCRSFGAGLYVSEMITARLLVARDPKTLELARFAPDESPKSIQIYGTDPYYLGEAVKYLVNSHGVDHIDMNFGCSVPKITRKGGGSAIPLKPKLFQKLVASAVKNAQEIPVTVKFRMGLDDAHSTYINTGKIAEGEGCAAIALHARTAEQFYGGNADWSAIKRLKQAVTTIPVLGNGDIWEASDALKMMHQTGCDGVVVGRGCLGRPWLFQELVAAFNGLPAPDLPNLGTVLATMQKHLELLTDWMDEKKAIFTFRKHCGWYLLGFEQAQNLRPHLMKATTLKQFTQIIADADPSDPFPVSALRIPRGKTGTRKKVALPDGYLDNLDDDTPPDASAEAPVSGG